MYILVNVGATKTKIGLSKNFEKIDKIEILNTLHNYIDFLKFFKNKFSSLKIKLASFGLPGVFNQSKNKLIYAPNLKDFENKNIKRDLEKILKCQVLLENDSALEGLGEAYFGKGKRFHIFAYITLGTGVGGVKIVNWEIDKKFFEFENIFSGRAIEKIFNKKPEEIKDKSIWSFYSEVLSAFLVNVSLFWSPEAIILNGSLIQSLNKKILLNSFKKFFPFNLKPKITFSNLKEKAGIYGALIYIKKNLKYN